MPGFNFSGAAFMGIDCVGSGNGDFCIVTDRATTAEEYKR
jgi:hypothetical protein